MDVAECAFFIEGRLKVTVGNVGAKVSTDSHGTKMLKEIPPHFSPPEPTGAEDFDGTKILVGTSGAVTWTNVVFCYLLS